ncbi:uncharacterized protein AMSG_11275 [Thecamonas trahens ATCC 50062]|uniref:Uncharacterized protein n=1 Tax=Thecamonas trahens ATCC 50062 TaxID=461836 RepID=A0A0L0DU27_THETB|nr:hypothetical protein AMSG_11275 [Thecamonas trahens ATCC 50062]KNC55834.1 hypothetical protein AMSG_11275 [Thecamonas trahens ATCC 50062]|eukprot:XP_013752811.1 hypothetical protein AMSG_11275 [Thecamonas trahens ATCC 50062]
MQSWSWSSTSTSTASSPPPDPRPAEPGPGPKPSADLALLHAKLDHLLLVHEDAIVGEYVRRYQEAAAAAAVAEAAASSAGGGPPLQVSTGYDYAACRLRTASATGQRLIATPVSPLGVVFLWSLAALLAGGLFLALWVFWTDAVLALGALGVSPLDARAVDPAAAPGAKRALQILVPLSAWALLFGPFLVLHALALAPGGRVAADLPAAAGAGASAAVYGVLFLVTVVAPAAEVALSETVSDSARPAQAEAAALWPPRLYRVFYPRERPCSLNLLPRLAVAAVAAAQYGAALPWLALALVYHPEATLAVVASASALVAAFVVLLRNIRTRLLLRSASEFEAIAASAYLYLAVHHGAQIGLSDAPPARATVRAALAALAALHPRGWPDPAAQHLFLALLVALRYASLHRVHIAGVGPDLAPPGSIVAEDGSEPARRPADPLAPPPRGSVLDTMAYAISGARGPDLPAPGQASVTSSLAARLAPLADPRAHARGVVSARPIRFVLRPPRWLTDRVSRAWERARRDQLRALVSSFVVPTFQFTAGVAVLVVGPSHLLDAMPVTSTTAVALVTSLVVLQGLTTPLTLFRATFGTVADDDDVKPEPGPAASLSTRLHLANGPELPDLELRPADAHLALDGESDGSDDGGHPHITLRDVGHELDFLRLAPPLATQPSPSPSSPSPSPSPITTIHHRRSAAATAGPYSSVLHP